ncbi:MAG: hypothetical protein WC966_02450 [Bradymonadales bacterium]|jgi:hypothetical protein
MIHANVKKLSLLIVLAMIFAASTAYSAEVTDVLDAADQVYLEDKLVDDVFDISLTPIFRQRYEWAKIKREYKDVNSRSVRILNELKYERVINSLDVDLEVGLYHDLALRMSLPIVLSDQQGYRYDDDLFTIYENDVRREIKIDGENSYFSPSNPGSGFKFFDLVEGETLKGRKRSGIGDLKIGIAWSPINTERRYDPNEPWKDNTGRSTVTLAFDYIAPTGKTMKIDNSNVGRGLHELIFSVAASQRFKYVEPYTRLQFGLPINSGKSAFEDFGRNQIRKSPGMWGRADLGIEFIAFERRKLDFQHSVRIDLRGYFKYVGEGREYSELMDAFGTNDFCRNVSADIAASSNCGWVTSKWSNAGKDNIEAVANSTYTGNYSEDGIFDNEGYAVVGGALNLYIEPVQYLKIVAGVAADYEQNHFITFTKVGKDRGSLDSSGNFTTTKDGVVSDARYEERNPSFSSTLDTTGDRIRKTEALNLEWFVGLKFMY